MKSNHYAKKTSQRSGVRPCSLSGLTSTFRHKCRRAQRHDSSGAALRNSETIVIVSFSMIPHIDLLWHMHCSAL